MIVASQLSKRYPGGYEALADVSFEISAGQMVFITGHSGAGKTTLVKLIASIERPTSGSLVVNGQNLSALRRSAIPYLRRNFGMVFQDQKLLFDRSVLTLSGTTSDTYSPVITIAQATDSTMVLLDTGLLRDDDDGLHIIAALAPAESGRWGGASVFRSVDDAAQGVESDFGELGDAFQPALRVDAAQAARNGAML